MPKVQGPKPKRKPCLPLSYSRACKQPYSPGAPTGGKHTFYCCVPRVVYNVHLF